MNFIVMFIFNIETNFFMRWTFNFPRIKCLRVVYSIGRFGLNIAVFPKVAEAQVCDINAIISHGIGLQILLWIKFCINRRVFFKYALASGTDVFFLRFYLVGSDSRLRFESLNSWNSSFS